MAGNPLQKQKLLYLLDILLHKTDEDHPLNATEICDELAKSEIKAERKSIYHDIRVLEDYGYEIISTRYPKTGFYMADRDFELAEVRLLMDAVQSAGFITQKKTKELLVKLNRLVSDHQAIKLRNQVYIDSRVKNANEEIYYNIDHINTAIDEGKKISLKYRRLHMADIINVEEKVKEMVISPYALLWSSDHYYLVGNNEKYDNLIHMRLDRMKNVQVLSDQPLRPFSEVSPYKNFFDIADYAKKSFNMFGGSVMTVELKCPSEIIEEVYDRFGSQIPIRSSGEDHFVFKTNAMLSEGLVSWITSFGTIEVLAPRELREMVCERIEGMKKIYQL